MRFGAALCGLLIFAVVGAFTFKVWTAPISKVPENVVCRPSVPEQLPVGPKVLFWGNSLAFDHSWKVDGHLAVNCARQGMTAMAAVSHIDALPNVDISASVVIFGTVELVRGLSDPAPFFDAVEQNVAGLKAKYPGAQVFLVGVPEGSLEVWRYHDTVSGTDLNDPLQDIDETHYVDTTRLLSQIPDSKQTYDGVHLTDESYGLIQDEISLLLNK